MTPFTFEEMTQFVKTQIAEKKAIVHCVSRNTSCHTPQTFIRLENALSYEAYWRGGVLSFNKGDYIHADVNDFYGISAQTFQRCFIAI